MQPSTTQDLIRMPSYAHVQTQELPLAMTVPAAAKLCGLEERVGYWLAYHEWQPFVRRYGSKGNGLLVRTAGLLAWLEGTCEADGEDSPPEAISTPEQAGGKPE